MLSNLCLILNQKNHRIFKTIKKHLSYFDIKQENTEKGKVFNKIEKDFYINKYTIVQLSLLLLALL